MPAMMRARIESSLRPVATGGELAAAVAPAGVVALGADALAKLFVTVVDGALLEKPGCGVELAVVVSPLRVPVVAATDVGVVPDTALAAPACAAGRQGACAAGAAVVAATLAPPVCDAGRQGACATGAGLDAGVVEATLAPPVCEAGRQGACATGAGVELDVVDVVVLAPAVCDAGRHGAEVL